MNVEPNRDHSTKNVDMSSTAPGRSLQENTRSPDSSPDNGVSLSLGQTATEQLAWSRIARGQDKSPSPERGGFHQAPRDVRIASSQDYHATQLHEPSKHRSGFSEDGAGAKEPKVGNNSARDQIAPEDVFSSFVQPINHFDATFSGSGTTSGWTFNSFRESPWTSWNNHSGLSPGGALAAGNLRQAAGAFVLPKVKADQVSSPGLPCQSRSSSNVMAASSTGAATLTSNNILSTSDSLGSSVQDDVIQGLGASGLKISLPLDSSTQAAVDPGKQPISSSFSNDLPCTTPTVRAEPQAALKKTLPANALTNNLRNDAQSSASQLYRPTSLGTTQTMGEGGTRLSSKTDIVSKEASPKTSTSIVKDESPDTSASAVMQPAADEPPIWEERRHPNSFKAQRLSMEPFEEVFGHSFDILAQMNPDHYIMPWGSRVVCVKTSSTTNLLLSVKNSIWACATPVSERILALWNKKGKDEKVLLLFSIPGSKQFSGLAEIVEFNVEEVTDFWENGEVFTGTMIIKWVYCKIVPYDEVRAVVNEKFENESATQMWNGMHYSEPVGRLVIKAYVEYPHTENLLARPKHSPGKHCTSKRTGMGGFRGRFASRGIGGQNEVRTETQDVFNTNIGALTEVKTESQDVFSAPNEVKTEQDDVKSGKQDNLSTLGRTQNTDQRLAQHGNNEALSPLLPPLGADQTSEQPIVQIIPVYVHQDGSITPMASGPMPASGGGPREVHGTNARMAPLPPLSSPSYLGSNFSNFAASPSAPPGFGPIPRHAGVTFQPPPYLPSHFGPNYPSSSVTQGPSRLRRQPSLIFQQPPLYSPSYFRTGFSGMAPSPTANYGAEPLPRQPSMTFQPSQTQFQTPEKQKQRSGAPISIPRSSTNVQLGALGGLEHRGSSLGLTPETEFKPRRSFLNELASPFQHRSFQPSPQQYSPHQYSPMMGDNMAPGVHRQQSRMTSDAAIQASASRQASMQASSGEDYVLHQDPYQSQPRYMQPFPVMAPSQDDPFSPFKMPTAARSFPPAQAGSPVNRHEQTTPSSQTGRKLGHSARSSVDLRMSSMVDDLVGSPSRKSADLRTTASFDGHRNMFSDT